MPCLPRNLELRHTLKEILEAGQRGEVVGSRKVQERYWSGCLSVRFIIHRTLDITQSIYNCYSSFQRSSENNRQCPEGRECKFQHRSADGSPYIFQRGPVKEKEETREAYGLPVDIRSFVRITLYLILSPLPNCKIVPSHISRGFERYFG